MGRNGKIVISNTQVNEVKKLRQELKLSLTELAQALGVARRTITRWQQGERTRAHPIYLERMREMVREKVHEREREEVGV